MSIAEILERLESLAALCRTKAVNGVRPIDVQLWDAKAEAYAAAAELVRKYDDGGNDGG